ETLMNAKVLSRDLIGLGGRLRAMLSLASLAPRRRGLLLMLQRAQHCDMCVHYEIATFSCAYQHPCGKLPFLTLLFGLWKALDKVGGIAKGFEAAAVG